MNKSKAFRHAIEGAVLAAFLLACAWLLTPGQGMAASVTQDLQVRLTVMDYASMGTGNAAATEISASGSGWSLSTMITQSASTRMINEYMESPAAGTRAGTPGDRRLIPRTAVEVLGGSASNASPPVRSVIITLIDL